MKLTINEKIGFGAGDMAIAIVMMSLAMIITYFYTEFHSQATVMSAMTGVRAAVVPIMASAILGLVRGAFPMRICYAVAAAALGLYLFLHVNCVWLVAGGAAAGLIISRFWKGGRDDGAA